MSRLLCNNCGFILKDGTEEDLDNYWGTIVNNGEFFEALEDTSKNLAIMMEKYKEGNLKEWMKENNNVYGES